MRVCMLDSCGLCGRGRKFDILFPSSIFFSFWIIRECKYHFGQGNERVELFLFLILDWKSRGTQLLDTTVSSRRELLPLDVCGSVSICIELLRTQLCPDSVFFKLCSYHMHQTASKNCV